jgi:hypothetical protein
LGWRDPLRIVHSLADVIRAGIFAIACGYEDGNDLDHLRGDPAFKLACGRLPGFVFAADLVAPGECTAPARGDPAELRASRLWMDSYARAPRAVTTTPSTWCMAVSNFAGSTPITTSTALCRSTSTRPSAAGGCGCPGPGTTPSGVEVRGHWSPSARRRHAGLAWPEPRHRMPKNIFPNWSNQNCAKRLFSRCPVSWGGQNAVARKYRSSGNERYRRGRAVRLRLFRDAMRETPLVSEAVVSTLKLNLVF